MKKLLVFLTFTFCTTALHAQTTAVTIQVTDAGGQTWNNGSWQVQIVTNSQNFPAVNLRVSATNTPVPAPVPNVGNLNATGGFATVALTPNASIAPVVNQWQFTVCPNAQSACFVQAFTIAGATQTVTLTPPIPQVIAISPTTTAYADNEILNPVPGTQYYNIVSNSQRICNGPSPCVWASSSTAGSPAGSSGAIQFAQGGIFTGTSKTLKCNTSMAGSDLGAKLNTCISAVAQGIADASELSGSQTLSTAVTVSADVCLVFGSNTNISQSATITLSKNSCVRCAGDKSTAFNKAANIDQFVMSGDISTVNNQNVIEYCQLNGNKASFTGNGIVIGSSTLHVKSFVFANVINGEAGDAIKDISTAYTDIWSIIQGNFIQTFGTHAIEIAGGIGDDIFDNQIFGDGTATGSDVLISIGNTKFHHNVVKDNNAAPLVDSSNCASSCHVDDNTVAVQSSVAQPAIKSGGFTIGNNFSGTSGNNTALVTGGVFSKNVVNGSGAGNFDVVLVQGNNITVSENAISLNVAGAVNGACALNFKADQINNTSSKNNISVSDTQNIGNVDNAICDTTTGGHNLNMLFEGDIVTGFLSGTVTTNAFVLNNAGNVSTNWSVTWRDERAVHIGAPVSSGSCIKRTDTQNQITTWEDFQCGDSTSLDAGTGSNKDIFVIHNGTLPFASLFSPVGNGSQIYCVDCTQAKPTASGGTGAYVIRDNGQWNGY